MRKILCELKSKGGYKVSIDNNQVGVHCVDQDLNYGSAHYGS
jgi:hypothetical protein